MLLKAYQLGKCSSMLQRRTVLIKSISPYDLADSCTDIYYGKTFINSLFAFFQQEPKKMHHKRKLKCKLVICLTSSATISTNYSPCFQESESFLSFSFSLPSYVKPINFFPSLYSLLCQMPAIIILNSNCPPFSSW